MCSRLILKIAGGKERQPTSTEPWNDSFYEDQYSVPLPPIQVTRNKAITYSYTIWDSVSLDIGFLATAVKNSVMLKRRPCRLKTADCADRADCADWVLFVYLYLNFQVKFLL